MYLRPIQPYSLCERILRTAVFQIGVFGGFLERFLIRIYKIFSACAFRSFFNPKQAENALTALVTLGAIVSFVAPKDGKARLQMMSMRSDVLEQKLKAFGARWEKMPHKNRSILAVIPPLVQSKEWLAFEKDLLTLKWKKEKVKLPDSSVREVIVTCENADAVPDSEWHRNLFIHTNSAGVSFIMLKRRVGFYLGCKQNLCFYDPRGTWKSSGIASEAGYYNDIEAVYNKAKTGFDPQKIWLSGTCGGVGATAYLKAKLHATGVNLVLESSSPNLKRDWIDTQSWLVRKFANRYQTALYSRDIPAGLKPKETGFNLEELWKDLRLSDIGKVMVVTVSNDQLLSPQVAKSNIELARRVNRNVFALNFKSPSKTDPHTDFYFKYPIPTSQALSFIFK